MSRGATAQGYQVTGFVKNLGDGRVQLVAEGPPGELAGFLAEIESTFHGYIGQVRGTSKPATGEFSSFDIRF